MRLKISKSKNSTSLYVIKTIYVDGKEYTKTVEKLGTVADLEKRLDDQNPIEWTKEDKQNSFNAGYLFLQQIYHELSLHKI